jgi:hypothetical protein
LQAGASVAAASQAVGVSGFTGYRWLAEAGGPDALGLARCRGRPWGGRKGVEVRDVFWAELRRGATITAAARAAGVARQTGAVWLSEAGGVRPRVIDLKLEHLGIWLVVLHRPMPDRGPGQVGLQPGEDR